MGEPLSDGTVCIGLDERAHIEYTYLKPERLEKVSGPEPEWVNGDVIRLTSVPETPLLRVAGKWVWSDTGGPSLSQDLPEWADGKVTILHKLEPAA